ncbi:MAG: hypothetical protein PHV30_07385 [Candidatus Margulisbacteria bacterium]|nr:hypothetical protein [Candidatus Margulisiibacteriota bacterium]
MKKISICVLCLSLLLLTACGKVSNELNDNVNDKAKADEQNTTINNVLKNIVFSEMEYFPIDLDAYFNQTGVSVLQEEIKHGRDALIAPFLDYRYADTPENIGNLTIYPAQTNLSVYTPAFSLISRTQLIDTVKNAAVTKLNKEDVYDNVSLTLWLNSDKSLQIKHISILKNLADRVSGNSEGYITLNAHDLLGFTTLDKPLELIMDDKQVNNGLTEKENDLLNHRVTILPYLSKTVADTLNKYYSKYVYPKMKESNCWPFSSLSGSVDINLPETIWGRWFYKSGERDIASLNYKKYNFKNGVLTYINKNKLNSDTFSKAPGYPFTPIITECPEWDGLYNDLERKDGRYVVLITGNSLEGILGLKTFNKAKDDKETVYQKYKLLLMKAGSLDDELHVKFYTTLTESVKDTSFSNPLIYVKDAGKGTPLP